MSQNKIPVSFICPLTQDVMEDPVIDPEGNSYERQSIEQWLTMGNTTSPVTRTHLTIDQLVPNRALKDAIEEKRRLFPHLWNDGSQGGEKVEAEMEEKDVVGLTVHSQNLPDNDDDTVLKNVLIRVHPPMGEVVGRTPSDVCCVIDVSGSMGNKAMTKTGTSVEITGLSLLDVVKHAVKTVIKTMSGQDRLSVVAYASKARTVFGLMPMNDAAKARAIASVDTLVPTDSTNLWDGLKEGLDVLRRGRTGNGNQHRLSTVLLLTDGCPNVIPPRGHIPMLKRYFDEHGNDCVIHTFGFGYSLESELLDNVAKAGRGLYAFIPDSSFVGTSFVNATSNILVRMTEGATLKLETTNGATFEGFLGNSSFETTSWGAQLTFGALQCGQIRNFIAQVRVPSHLDMDPHQEVLHVTLQYHNRCPDVEPVKVEVSHMGEEDDQSEFEMERHRLRLSFVDTICRGVETSCFDHEDFMDNLVVAQVNLFELVTDIKTTLARLTPRLEMENTSSFNAIEALLKDAQGQVTEAFSRADWFRKWGIHYLRSITGAHNQELCNNFKDPGVQVYGGKLFKQIQDHADEIFLKLPAPTPSRRRTVGRALGLNARGGGGAATPSVNMTAVYNNRFTPCFAPECLVRMADGSTKRVDEIERGDLVDTPNSTGEVFCVVRTRCDGKIRELVTINSPLKNMLPMRVTPYHPIKIEGLWKFPSDIGVVRIGTCEAVYSFVLERKSPEHMMIINGIPAICLGHGISEGLVKHAFFGTECVIDALRKFPGWVKGMVHLEPGCTLRDPVTGLVCNIVSKESPEGVEMK